MPGICIGTWKSRGLVFSRTRRRLNFQNSLLIGKLYWNGWLELHYFRGTCSYVCRTKQGRKPRSLWGISWHHRIYNVITEMSPYNRVQTYFFLFNTSRLSVSVHKRSALLTPSKNSDREIVTSQEHARVSWLSAQSFADTYTKAVVLALKPACKKANERTHSGPSSESLPSIHVLLWYAKLTRSVVLASIRL
jgi:hypothetical protein